MNIANISNDNVRWLEKIGISDEDIKGIDRMMGDLSVEYGSISPKEAVQLLNKSCILYFKNKNEDKK